MCAAARIVVPSGTVAVIPFIVKFGIGPLEPVPVRAFLVLYVRIELLPELPEERLGGHHRRVGQRADRPAHHVVADVEDELHVPLAALPALVARYDLRK